MKASDLKKALGQSKYSVKGVKTHMGHDGPGYFECTVYKNGKRLGSMHEDSWGAGYVYDFSKKEVDELQSFSLGLFGKFGADSLIFYLLCYADIVKRAKRRRGKTTALVNENGMVSEYVWDCPKSAGLEKRIKKEKGESLLAVI